MSKIQNFEKVRRDGNVIGEMMTVRDMIELGWPAETVNEVRWLNELNQICLSFKFGVLARVVSGREYVAIIEGVDSAGKGSELWVLNSDGSRRLKISNVQLINGENVRGEFGWLEQPRSQEADVFGVIFGDPSASSAFHLDIDAKTGKIVGIFSVR